MASLGNIWFDLNLKDNTGKDLEKIIKELENKKIKISADIDKDELTSAMDKITKSSSKSNDNFEELAKTLGVSNSQAAEMVSNIKEASSSELALLNNAQRVTRAKERILELERSLVLKQMDNTKEGKNILAWTKEVKATLASLDLADKTSIIKTTGADLSAQINVRKDLMRHMTKSMNEESSARIANARKINAEELTLLNNTEKVKKAKEKILELERSVLLRGIEQSESGKEILEWTKEASRTLDAVDLADKTATIKATGADLSAQINIRKDLMRHATMSASEQVKGNRAVENSNLSIEKALLRIQKIRDRISNDPYRDQEGYKGVNAELDKMVAKLKGLKDKSSTKTKGYLAVGINRDVQAVENLIASQDRLYRKTTDQVTHMDRLWGQMGNKIKGIVSIYAVERFTRQLIEMGGEFEKQHYALRAIIGDLGRADQIFNNLRKVAVKSPFHFGDFTGYAKQLAAFSIPINEIYDTTKRLADVSAGLGVDMSRIILAYGQIRSASFLRGQEVRQLTEAGIPIIEELANKLSELKGQVVSTSEVFDSISRREVPFEMVKEVFMEMTDEGGKFYNMQEVLAESLSGKWSNLTSHYQIMLYDMAQSNRGYLNGLIEVLTGLVKNFRMVESAIVGMLSAYAMGNVIKMAGEFKGLSNALKNVGASFMDASKKIFSSGNMLVAGAFAVGTAITYVVSKTNEYRDKITDMIDASSRIEEVVTKHFEALINLANKERENIDVSVERHNVLLELAKTEPELADELKKHADNLGYLTKRTEEYTSALKTARTISLMLEKGDDKVSILFGKSAEEFADEIAKNEALISKRIAKASAGMYVLIEKYGERLHSAIRKSYGEKLGNEFIGILDDPTKQIEDKVKEMSEILDKNIKPGFFSKTGIFGDVFEDIMRSTSSGFQDLQDGIGMYSKGLVSKTKTAADMIKNELLRIDVKQYEKDADGVDRVTKEWTEAVMLRLSMLKDTSDGVKASISNFLGVDYKNSMNVSVATLDGWRKEVSDILKGVIHITDQTSLDDLLSSVNSEISNMKKYLESIDINKLREVVTAGIGTDAQKALLKDYEAKEEAQKKLLRVRDLLGLREKKDTSNRDPYAEKIRKRIDLIKEAKSTYEKYIPLLGKAKALEKVNEDSRFGSLNFSPDGYKESLMSIYNSLGKSKEQQRLKEDLEKTFSDIDFNNVKFGIDKLTSEINKYISENKERWNLLDSLFENTGDYKLSFTLAFGTEADDDIANYAESLERKLSEILGQGVNMDEVLGMSPSDLEDNFGKPVLDLVENLKKERIKTQKDILLSDAKAIAETATIAEKAKAIRAKYTKKIDDTENEKAKAAHLELMHKELSDLYSKAIQLSPIWRDLFGDVSDYSYKMLKNLVKEAEKLMETAEEIKDKDGKGTGNFKLTDKESGDEYILSAEEYTRMLKSIGKKSEEIRQRNPFSALAKSWRDFVDAPEGTKDVALMKLMGAAAMAADEVANIASAFSDMFDAIGNDKLSDTVGLIGDITGSLGGIAAGFAQGGVGGAAIASLSAIPNIIGSIAKKHDKKLDKKIQKSALEVKKLQNAYDRVNREVERQLGAMTKGQVDEQIGSLEKQIEETYNMMDKEREKKKSDKSKIADYERQLEEMHEELLYFYEDLANSLYNIDLKGWAGEFSSVIIDAWRNGSDAALAYEKTANEVLANVANKMLAESILEPVFEKLREELPDMMKKGHLTDDDMGIIAALLVEVGDQIDKGFDYVDKVNDMIETMSDGSLSLKLKDDLESNLGQGIQSMTEDTAQLLGSYLNAIRQDVSVKRELLSQIASFFDGSSVGDISAMVANIKKIEANTFRSANGVDSINEKLESVMNGTKQIYTS